MSVESPQTPVGPAQDNHDDADERGGLAPRNLGPVFDAIYNEEYEAGDEDLVYEVDADETPTPKKAKRNEYI